jgi:hypothetical protein
MYNENTKRKIEKGIEENFKTMTENVSQTTAQRSPEKKAR